MDDLIVISERQLAAAFTEWDRRYREEPERFMSEAQRVLQQTPKTYGEAAAPYLVELLEECKSEQGEVTANSALSLDLLADELLRQPWKPLGYYAEVIGESDLVTLRMLRLLGAQHRAWRAKAVGGDHRPMLRLWALKGEACEPTN